MSAAFAFGAECRGEWQDNRLPHRIRQGTDPAERHINIEYYLYEEKN